MHNIGEHFKLNNSNRIANPDSIIKGNKYRITVLTERLLRLEYQESGEFDDYFTESIRNRTFNKPEFNVIEQGLSLEISTKYFTFVYEKEAPFIGPDNNPNQYCYLKINGTDKEWYPNKKDPNNYKGNRINLLSNENEDSFLSGNMYYVLDESDSLLLDDFGTIFSRTEEKTDIYIFVYQNDLSFGIADYYRLTGLAPLIPRYTMGNTIIDDRKLHSEEILWNIDQWRTKNIYLSSYILGDNWAYKNYKTFGSKTSFTFNQDLIPSMKELVLNLHKKGIFVGLKINPEEGLCDSEINYENLCKFLSYDENNKLLVDPKDPKFIDTYLKLLTRPLENFGIDFFYNDYVGDKHSMWSLNHYTSLDALRVNRRPYILTYNSQIVPHNNPIAYAGNTLLNNESLLKNIDYQISSINLCNVSTSVSINGNYIQEPDYNLLIRNQQNTLLSLTNIINFNDENYKYFNFNISNPNINYMIKLWNLRQRLLPHIYSEYYKFHKFGLLYRLPLYFINPALYNTVYKYESLISSFLVVPIVNPSIKHTDYNKVDIHLPEGRWYNYFTGELYEGIKEYSTFYNTSEYPLFVKAGAIIVRNGDDYPYTYINPNTLDIDIYPSGSNKYILYEDDGITNNYKDNSYFKTEINYINRQNEYEINIKCIDGKNSIVPSKRNYRLHLKNVLMFSNIYAFLDNQNVAYTYYRDGKDLIIEIKNIDVLKVLNIKIIHNKPLENVYLSNDTLDLNKLIYDLKINNIYKKQLIDDIHNKCINEKNIYKTYAEITDIEVLKILEFYKDLIDKKII